MDTPPLMSSGTSSPLPRALFTRSPVTSENSGENANVIGSRSHTNVSSLGFQWKYDEPKVTAATAAKKPAHA
eukprot:CAMPEP_0198226442 /NCGR_PEP_ID=MMETSP1445-20131203/105275_1 /TAXON_ID=36898 /ORGANISM="Pyramimonas sp., Strain CCMP2087" /LENGTH=71 /DNA_ID=CAMNT_0043906251 /DNA_START=627 /DNA_END=842 /DNA_ORIENTATION=-